MATRSYRDRVRFTTATTGTGTVTQGSAVSGYQVAAAADDGKEFTIRITDGTAWEVSKSVYTHAGTTWTRVLIASSTGSLLSLNAGADVAVDWISESAQDAFNATLGIVPGGRLTLTSGTPVTTADVTGATNVYYTPYVSNIINLWDGAVWKPTIFTETTEALGTLTSGLPYDVFGFLSSGALDLEKLVWTNDTTRATAVTLQDGRYCKDGDKTRLLLGTFYTTATTTTEDSVLLRYLSNVYNFVPRPLYTGAITGANHTYGTATWREWNGGTNATRLNFVATLAKPISGSIIAEFAVASPQTAFAGLNVDSTSADPGESVGGATVSGGNRIGSTRLVNVAAGKHYICAMEYGTGTTPTFANYWLSALI